MDFQHWLHEAVNQLRDSGSWRDAGSCLKYVTGRADVYHGLWRNAAYRRQQQQLADLLQRRKRGEPIAYLTGLREFLVAAALHSRHALIPRPDTECLVEQALARLPIKTCRILDLGAGTGAIALALCDRIAGDCGRSACLMRLRWRCNAEHLAIRNVRILQKLLVPARYPGQQFDMIVSNPPYIDAGPHTLAKAMYALNRARRWWRTKTVWRIFTHIIINARQMLTPGGFLLLEHGWQQGRSEAVFRRSGYSDVETCRDYGGNERVTCGRLRHDNCNVAHAVLSVLRSPSKVCLSLVTGGAIARPCVWPTRWTPNRASRHRYPVTA